MTSIDWILIADRSRAVILRALPDSTHPFATVASFVHSEGRLRPRDQESDVPGSVQHPGGARSTVEPHEDRWHVEARRFAKELADTLDLELQKRHFERLVVIAPAPFLGVLRDEWPPRVRACIITDRIESLLTLSESDRQERLNLIMESVYESAV